jgi:hypothetical protein
MYRLCLCVQCYSEISAVIPIAILASQLLSDFNEFLEGHCRLPSESYVCQPLEGGGGFLELVLSELTTFLDRPLFSLVAEYCRDLDVTNCDWEDAIVLLTRSRLVSTLFQSILYPQLTFYLVGFVIIAVLFMKFGKELQSS